LSNNNNAGSAGDDDEREFHYEEFSLKYGNLAGTSSTQEQTLDERSSADLEPLTPMRRSLVRCSSLSDLSSLQEALEQEIESAAASDTDLEPSTPMPQHSLVRRFSLPNLRTLQELFGQEHGLPTAPSESEPEHQSEPAPTAEPKPTHAGPAFTPPAVPQGEFTFQVQPLAGPSGVHGHHNA
jgi:hypothetical protein